MIETTMAVVSLICLVLTFFWKAYNCSKENKVIPPIFTFLTFGFGLICWIIFFMSMSSTLLSNDPVLLPGFSIYTATDQEYSQFILFTNFANFIFAMVSALTVIEVLFILKNTAEATQIKPLISRGSSYGRR